MESALHTHQQQMAQTQEELRPLHAAHAELSGEIELVSDSTENIQWGLTWVAIQCVDTRSAPKMVTLERANLIASRTMSMQRYMNTVRSQNRGVIQGADDTDMKKKEKKKKKKIKLKKKQKLMRRQSLHLKSPT